MKNFTLLLLFILMLGFHNPGYSQTYCTAGCYNWGMGYMGIDNVTLGSINNTSGYGVGYQDFTYLTPTTLVSGSNYSFTISLAGYPQYWAVWIDFNHNGSFYDAGEKIYASTSYVQGATTFTVSIPSGLSYSGNTRMRVRSEYYGYSTPTDPCNYVNYGEAEDYTVSLTLPTPWDIDIISMAPMTVKAGNNNVTATIKNNGYQTLTTGTPINLQYNVDNGSWVSSTFNLTAPLTAGQTLNYTFPTPWNVTTQGPFVLCGKIYPQLANDPDALDQLCQNVYVGMAGVYTINPNGSGSYNFPSFSAAVTALGLRGVAGPVTFNVTPGQYNDNANLTTSILGLSAANPIVFDGGSRTGTILASNSNVPTVRLANVSYITFQNMTITSNGSSYYIGVAFKGNATYNSFINCQIEVPSYPSTYYIPIMFANSDYSYSTSSTGCDYNLIKNCGIKGGYFGTTMYGNSTSTSYNNYNQFIGNTFSDHYYYGFYRYYASAGLVMRNNTFKNIGTSTSYGFMSYYANNTTFDGNIVQAGYMGAYFFYENMYQTGTTYIVNNMISNFTYPSYHYGLYLYYSNNFMVQHNTIAIRPTSTSYSYTALYMYYINYTSGGGTMLSSRVEDNIFINYGSGTAGSCVYGYYCTLANFDYNNYYYPQATYCAYWQGSLYNTLFAWKSGYPALNVNSINQDPDIKSYADLHLNTGSPGVRGILTNVVYDVDGQTRCTLASFLGADEPFMTSSPADFIVADTVCYVTPVTFYNKGNEKSPHISSWYVDNVFKSSDFHYITSFTTTGYDSVKLVMKTCAGTTTKAKRIYVSQPTKAPSTEFVASKNVAEANEPVYINDVSLNCPTKWLWRISPDTVMDPVTKLMVPSFEFLNNCSYTSQNLAVAFKYSGKYSVCLVTENGIGVGNQKCKTDYINVKFIDNMCGAITRTSEQFGSLYDDGGPSANFAANGTTCKYLIKTCSDDVKITFREFNLPTGSYLRLYDGMNNRGIPMWDQAYGASGISGFMNDNRFDTILMATKSGAVYIEFQKGTISGLGFRLEWESFGKGNYTMPTAEFTSFDTGCIVYPVAYKNISLPGVNDLEFYWDYDGNSSIDANTIDGLYLPTFTGLQATYNTKLIAENCGGTDTFIKSIVLINPLSITNTEFSANVTQPVIYQDEVTLQPTGPRLECVNKWQWIINPSGKYYYAQGYSSASQYPRVVFTDTGCFDVTLIVGNTNSASTQRMFKSCYIQPITYCTPKVLVKHQDLGISRVKIGTIDNSSQVGVAAYTSYTNLDGTDLFVGQKYGFSVERNTNYNAINRKIWIDYNRDGIFDPIGEMVAKQDSSKSIIWNDTFTVPGNAPYGATVLRIGTAYANYPNTPCGPNYFGEFEDYRVYVKQDNIPPVITLNDKDTVNVEKGYTYTDQGATALDNIDGNLTSYIQTTNNVNTAVVGTYHVTYHVCDFLNNCSTKIRVVNVTPDVTPPVLTLLGKDTILWNVNIPYVDPGYTANDLGDGNLTSAVIQTTNLNYTKLGTYTIIYTVTDSRGLSDSKKRTVIVLDGAAPSISLIGANPIYVNINSTYTEPGVVYADNYWPNNKIILQVTGLVDVTSVGTYPITYSVTDASGNGPNTISRNVIVYDSVAPVISTSGDDVITLEVYNQFYDPGVNILDNSISGLTVYKYGNFYDKYPNGIPTKIGNYIIFYYVLDKAGNRSNTLGRVVQVVDATAPKLELIGNDYVYIQRWQTYTDAGYTLSDNYYANKDITVDMQSNVNTIANGLYSVCYTATDPSGNQSPSVCRLVRVIQEWSSINDPSASNGVKVSPNPTTGKLSIELKLDQSNNAKIVLLNLLGEEVRVISDGTFTPNSLDVNLSDLANGVYMLKVQTNSKTVLERIVLNK
jgi:hypothetical protein